MTAAEGVSNQGDILTTDRILDTTCYECETPFMAMTA